MKEHQTRYTCDHCKKKVTTSEEIGFPYHLNWVYLQKFNGRFNDNKKITNKTDKHFCSKKCLLEYLNEQIKKS